MKFVKFVDNYSDEFEVLGYALFEDNMFLEWNRAMIRAAELMAFGYEFELWFGTNECIAYDRYYPIGESCEVHEVYGPDAYAINKYIVEYNKTVGVFPTTEMLVQFIEECEERGC